MQDVLSAVLKMAWYVLSRDVLSYIQTTRMLAREFKTLRTIQKKKIRKIKITRKFLNLQLEGTWALDHSPQSLS